MAYLHCHTKDCGWSQGDFWEDPRNPGASKYCYHPFRKQTVDDWIDYLFKDKIYLDLSCFEDMGMDISKIHKDEKGSYVDSRVYVAFELRRRARSIENMDVKTCEEWNKTKDSWTCPKCGQRNWDID